MAIHRILCLTPGRENESKCFDYHKDEQADRLYVGQPKHTRCDVDAPEFIRRRCIRREELENVKRRFSVDRRGRKVSAPLYTLRKIPTSHELTCAQP